MATPDVQLEPIDLLIRGPDIVTLDPAQPVIPHGALAIRDGRIVWLGPLAEADERYRASETLDAFGRLAMPGLVDTHFHTGQQLLRGKLIELGRRRELRLPIWRNYLVPFEACLTEEDVYASGLLAYTNMLRVGTTCFAEAGGPFPDQMGQAAEEVGIRGFVSRSTMDMGEGLPSAMVTSTRQALDENAELVRRWSSGRRVRAWLSLRQLIVCTSELWQAMGELADELGTRVHTHLAEGTYEVDFSTERWGKRPAEHLADIGFLGPRMHAAHSILLSAGEVQLYAEHGITVAHCPMGNYLIGVPKVADMWRRGISVGLGSDGASNGSIDLFRAAHVAWVAQQAHFGTPWHDRSVFSPDELLTLATVGGARALGLGDKLGSLQPGRLADLLIVDPSDLDVQPVYDPAFTAARVVTGRDVQSVIVDGRVVMKNRELLHVDEDRLRSTIGQCWPRIMERFEVAPA